MITGQPGRFEVAKGKGVLCAVLLGFDSQTHQIKHIERIQIRE